MTLSLDQQSLDVQGEIRAGGQVADLNGRYTLRQGDSPGSFAGDLVTTGTLLQLDGPLDHLSVRGGLDLPAIPGLPLPLLGRIELDGTADLPAGNLYSLSPGSPQAPDSMDNSPSMTSTEIWSLQLTSTALALNLPSMVNSLPLTPLASTLTPSSISLNSSPLLSVPSR